MDSDLHVIECILTRIQGTPREVVGAVFNCCLVCRSWRFVASSDAVWRPIVLSTFGQPPPRVTVDGWPKAAASEFLFSSNCPPDMGNWRELFAYLARSEHKWRSSKSNVRVHRCDSSGSAMSPMLPIGPGVAVIATPTELRCVDASTCSSSSFGPEEESAGRKRTAEDAFPTVNYTVSDVADIGNGRIAALCRDRFIRVMDRESLPFVLCGVPENSFSLCAVKPSRKTAGGEECRTVTLVVMQMVFGGDIRCRFTAFDACTGEEIDSVMTDHRKMVKRFSTADDGRRLFTASANGSAFLWDVPSTKGESFSVVQRFQAPNVRPNNGGASCWSWDIDDRYVAADNGDSRIEVWDRRNVNTDVPFRTLIVPKEISRIEFSGDSSEEVLKPLIGHGKLSGMVIGSGAHIVAAFDIESGRLTSCLSRSGLNVAELSTNRPGGGLGKADFAATDAVYTTQQIGGLVLQGCNYRVGVWEIAPEPRFLYSVAVPAAADGFVLSPSGSTLITRIRCHSEIPIVAIGVDD